MPTVRLKAALSQGLRSSPDQDRTDQFLTDAYNVRPTKFGASTADGISQPLVKTVSHPFPQLFVGSKEIILADERALSTLNYSYAETAYDTGSGAPELSTLASWSAYGTYTHTEYQSSILDAGGGPWHFADLDGAYFLCNGQAVVFKVPGLAQGDGVGVFADKITFPLTCCELNGRVIFGGLSSFVNLLDSRFNALRDTASRYNYSWGGGSEVSKLGNLDDSYVWWSSIGYEDAYWPFFASWMMEDAAKVNEVWQRNEFGFARVPWQDSVWVVKPLGNGFVAYGEHGIAYFAQEDLTFGMTSVATFGVAGRGSVGGDRKKHVFVSTEGALWQLTADQQLTRLGYEELLTPLLSQDITVSYDEQFDEYYISNATKCYLKTPTGMAQSSQLVTSAQMHRGNVIGMYEESADTEIRILSDVFDFGNRNIKTINSIQLVGSDSANYSVIIYFRNDPTASFEDTGFITANADGRVQIGASAIEFMISVKAATATNKNLEDVLINYSEMRKRKLGDWL